MENIVPNRNGMHLLNTRGKNTNDISHAETS